MDYELSTDPVVVAMRNALSKAQDMGSLAKAGITTSTGAVWYDLRAPALLHVPVLTPIREKLARRSRPNPGKACNWKVINGLLGSGIDGMGYLPEGTRSGVKSISVQDAFATYTTLGEEGSITLQAELAGQGLEDMLALDRLLTLEKLMLKEEPALLFGNRSTQLGTPTTPTTGTVALASAALNTTYYVAVVALTSEGFAAASVTNGVVNATTVTAADGKTYTVNGGSSNKSAIATQAVTTGNALTATTPAIRGAVGYAWYVGTTNAAASLYLQKITTINSVLLDTVTLTGRQTADAITGDHSYNDGTGSGSNQVAAFDGLMMSALKSGSGAYYKALATGTAGTGTSLTADNAGGIEEINEMMLTMWDTYKVGVTELYMSSRTANAVYKKILTNASAPLLRFNKDANSGDMEISGGGRVAAYFSPVGNPYGGGKATINIHPNLPDGVITGWATELPAWYKNNETPAVAEVLCRRDYFSTDWPKRTLATEYGVYTDECLAVYAPWAMGVITNIAV
ncbi:MAG: hypothetical protein J0H99_12415 [Rhodospirillales bacterium]|nr:hypothetical protein [Rhodospirillales bacterium]